MGLHREHINGYDDFCKFFEKFESKGKTVHVYFSGSKLENGESWCDDCIRAWPVIEGVLKKLEGTSQEIEQNLKETETKKIEKQVLETKEENKPKEAKKTKEQENKPKEAKKTKEQENKPKEAKKTKEQESKPKKTKEPESKSKEKKEQDGKPEVARETKEQESKTTKVTEESAEKEESNDSYFIYVEVGDRPTWKDPKSSFRTDKRTNVMVLPSIIRWEGHQRLIGDQCENPELVEMLFTDEDD